MFIAMSKCRQFQGLSTGMSILTIPNHTIKLQLHRRRQLIIKKKIHKKNKFSCLSGVLVEWPQGGSTLKGIPIIDFVFFFRIFLIFFFFFKQDRQ